MRFEKKTQVLRFIGYSNCIKCPYKALKKIFFRKKLFKKHNLKAFKMYIKKKLSTKFQNNYSAKINPF